MTDRVLGELLAAIERREPVVLATVIDTRRSVPRRAGSKMLVYGDRRTSGTIGGGEMEARVVDEALACLTTGRPRRLNYSLLDPTAGDPGVCGGDVELYLEPHMPTTTVFVVGVGHVGAAVVELAHWLGYRVVAWDDRPELLAGTDEPDGATTPSSGAALADVTLTGPLVDALSTEPIDKHTRVVLVTRNAALDVELLPPLLSTAAPYIGLMGSDRRWRTTRSRLADAGVSETDLDRIQAPIGIEISAETPAEIAVSIMAEIVAVDRSPAEP